MIYFLNCINVIINIIDLRALKIFIHIVLDFVLNFYNMIEIKIFVHKIISIRIEAFYRNLKRFIE